LLIVLIVCYSTNNKTNHLPLKLKVMKQHYISPKRFLLSMLSILFLLSGVYAQFTPGAGGTLPAFTPFTQPEGKFGGLILKYSHRQNGYFAGSGHHWQVV
jgi:hypothetical protein